MPFLMITAFILWAGPGLNEGGAVALKTKGPVAFEQAWHERDILVYSKLND